MKTATPELIALLNSASAYIMADLYTYTLQSGQVLRYTSASVDITYAGNMYSARGPLMQRGTVRTVLGLEVDTLDITLSASATNTGHQINGEAFIPAALKGALDGATVLLQRAFFADWAQPPAGAVVLFSGRVSDMSGSRTELKIDVKSALELLNTKLPRNIYQAGCLHTLFDAGCAANKAAFVQTDTVTGNNGTGQWLQSGMSFADGWFDQGVLTFTSGSNAGQVRTVKKSSGGQFWFALPLPQVPGVGSTFTVYPGCNKTQATCQGKFNNLPRFRGYPYIPVPETTT
jgi:uncharacterized phage protein (TIGR02218 family)